MVNWKNLPLDLICMIASHFDSYADYVRLRVVCYSFASALPKWPDRQLNQVPWLMIPHEDEAENFRGFFSLLDKKIYSLNLSETKKKVCRGSCNGWIVTVEEGPKLNLLNPLTRTQCALPPISTFPSVEDYQEDRLEGQYIIESSYFTNIDIQSFFIDKIVLSSSPTEQYTAMATYDGVRRLAFCRCGDNKWCDTSSPSHKGFSDIIVHEGKFYAVQFRGVLFAGDIDALPDMQEIRVKLPQFKPSHILYLVSSSFGLVMVERNFEHEYVGERVYYHTIDFKIYKLVMKSPRPTWRKVKSLGDQVLFVGTNASLLIPSHAGLKGNHIYFTDNNRDLHFVGITGGHDIGMFSLKDRTVHKLEGFEGDPKLIWPPPIWVVPNPC